MRGTAAAFNFKTGVSERATVEVENGKRISVSELLRSIDEAHRAWLIRKNINPVNPFST